MTNSLHTDPFSTPSEVSVEEGHVILDGPNGIAFALTADAAVLLGERLIAAGRQAQDQPE